MSKDYFDDHCFLFEWQGEEHIVILKYRNPKIGNIVWQISKFEENFKGNEEFSDDLCSAMKIYAVDGSPNQKGITDILVDFN